MVACGAITFANHKRVLAGGWPGGLGWGKHDHLLPAQILQGGGELLHAGLCVLKPVALLVSVPLLCLPPLLLQRRAPLPRRWNMVTERILRVDIQQES